MKAVTPVTAVTFSDSVMLRRTPVALAIALMQGVALAQPAQNTTSADNPGAAGQFETSGQPTSSRHRDSRPSGRVRSPRSSSV